MAQAAKIIRNGLGWLLVGLLWIAVILVLFIVLSAIFSNVVYCGDSLDEYYALMERISKAEEQVEYYSEQLEECTRLLNEAFENNAPDTEKEDIMEAKKDNETNLKVERKALEILKGRHQRRHFDTDLSTGSSLGKRRNDK